MGSLAHPSSFPPARALPLALAKCLPSDTRQALHDDTRDWFKAWCAAHAISVRDLAAILGVSSPVAQRKLKDGSQITLTDIRSFPPRYRRELWLEFDRHCDSAA